MTDGVSDQAQAPPLMVHISEPCLLPPFSSLTSLTSPLSLWHCFWHSEHPFVCSLNTSIRQELLSHWPAFCWHASVLWVHHTSNHFPRSSLHLKRVRTRQVLLPPHLSLPLNDSSILLFVPFLLASVGLPHLLPSSPTTTLCSLWFTRSYVWWIVEMLALQPYASRLTIPVKSIGK